MITHPEKVLFPDDGITKGELAAYYEAVAAVMIPYIRARPVTMERYPAGIAQKGFIQKDVSRGFPDWLERVEVPKKDGTVHYPIVKDARSLLWVVNQNTITPHVWLSRADRVQQPDRLVFDLDPDVGVDFEAVRKAARDLKRQLADMGLTTFPMLTGGKGVHVVAPLTPKAKWPEVKDFAQRFALALAQAEPDRFTAALSKAKRTGRIFIDYLRNQRGATAVMPYSARAREGAPVAAPIDWEELGKMESGARFTVKDADLLLERASSRTLQGWGEAAQALPKA